MSKEVHSGRENSAKKAGRTENKITSGGIESAVEGFHGDILHDSPFTPTYGNHKRIGSQMAPMKVGGRGGSSEPMKKKLFDVKFRSKGL